MIQAEAEVTPQNGCLSLSVTSQVSKNLQRLTAAYGAAMTCAQIASELEYSAIYVAKKIGAAGYEHLPWVKAIAPHRRKRGLRWVYATEAVAKYLDTPQ